MQSTMFSRFLVAAALAVSFFAPASQAQETQRYIEINPAIPSDSSDKIEVLEFFGYTCSYCAEMEPFVEKWAQTLPANVVFKQVPFNFGNVNQRPLQQLYYTLQVLDRADLHSKVFTAIHQDKQRLFNQKTMGEWAEKQGVDRAKFDTAFDSFGVQTQVQRAIQLAETFKVQGTPLFIVGGQYMTSPAIAKLDYQESLDEATRLIELVSKK